MGESFPVLRQLVLETAPQERCAHTSAHTRSRAPFAELKDGSHRQIDRGQGIRVAFKARESQEKCLPRRITKALLASFPSCYFVSFVVFALPPHTCCRASPSDTVTSIFFLLRKIAIFAVSPARWLFIICARSCSS